MNETDGRAFRAAWINGVRATTRRAEAGYTAQWEAMPEWERQAAAAVGNGQVKALQSNQPAEQLRMSMAVKGAGTRRALAG